MTLAITLTLPVIVETNGFLNENNDLATEAKNYIMRAIPDGSTILRTIDESLNRLPFVERNIIKSTTLFFLLTNLGYIDQLKKDDRAKEQVHDFEIETGVSFKDLMDLTLT